MSLVEALNPNTSAKRLQEILDLNNPKLCCAIAINPNTSPEVLLKLFKICPLEVLNNPVLELILLEIPDFLEQLYKINYYVLGENNLPSFFIEWAIKNPNSEMRHFLAYNHNLPKYYLAKLSLDENVGVRQGVATNKNTPIQILEKLVEDENAEVRASIAANQNTLIRFLTKLSLDKNIGIRCQIAANKNTPIEILERLSLDKNPDIRCNLAKNENITVSILEKLAIDKYPRVRIAVMQNNKSDRTIVEQIFENKNYVSINPDRVPVWEIRDAIEQLEMKRLNWTEKQKERYLLEKYKTDSLFYITDQQLLEFWQYLKAIA